MQHSHKSSLRKKKANLRRDRRPFRQIETVSARWISYSKRLCWLMSYVEHYVRTRYKAVANLLETIWNQNFDELWNSVQEGIAFYASLVRRSDMQTLSEELERFSADSRIAPFLEDIVQPNVLARAFGGRRITREDIAEIRELLGTLNPGRT